MRILHPVPGPPLPGGSPSTSSTSPSDLLQGWLQGWALHKMASQLNISKLGEIIPSMQWMGANVHPSLHSPLMPIGLGVALFTIPLIVSVVVYAIQLTMLAIAGAHFGPLVVDGLLYLQQPTLPKSNKPEAPTKAKSKATNGKGKEADSHTITAGIAGALAIGYSIGAVASLVILASSAYGCLHRSQKTKKIDVSQIKTAPKPVRVSRCPFARTARHCRDVVRVVSGRA